MVKEVDRRSVLKRVGAAGAVGAGLATGTASACGGNELIEMPPAEMAATVSEHASDELETLYTEEIIPEPTVEPLSFDQRSPGELAHGADGAFAAQVDDAGLVHTSRTVEVEETVGRLNITISDVSLEPMVDVNVTVPPMDDIIVFHVGNAYRLDQSDVHPCDDGSDCFEKERCYRDGPEDSVPGLAKYAVPDKFPKIPPCQKLGPLCDCQSRWNDDPPPWWD